jgi:Short C-terminal domain
MLLRPYVRNGRPGLIGRTAGATIVVGLARRQLAKGQRTDAQQAAAGQPAAPADPIARLKQLAALKDQGALTEEEFTVQKARILEP